MSELTVGSTAEDYRALNLVNYHIECIENRILQQFTDPTVGMEATILKSNNILKQNYQ